ncbi:MAG TPA: helix-turn-helix domain-containing protein [Candidatus Acidoferrales bacterium]|nr:helix-turn-helix domain-containing protein [Candidatus Acidoferrales bacterium]
MRRLIVEFSSRTFGKLLPDWPIQKIRSMEVLHFLRLDYKEVAMILRVEFNEPNVSIENIFPNDLVEAQLLEHEKERKKGKECETYTYFIKAPRPGPDLTAAGVYVSLPYEIRGGKVKITFLGNAKQVRDFIKQFDQAGVSYRVVSHTDAEFSPHSPLNRLTEKQRRVFIMAHKLGYYDIPKKIRLVKLAEKLNLAYSTLDVQLRRAERRLLNHIMNES